MQSLAKAAKSDHTTGSVNEGPQSTQTSLSPSSDRSRRLDTILSRPSQKAPIGNASIHYYKPSGKDGREHLMAAAFRKSPLCVIRFQSSPLSCSADWSRGSSNL